MNMDNNETSQVPDDDIEKGFRELYSIIKKLRSEDGCAWDREQTVYSLMPNLLEETYELFEAVENNSWEHSTEEIGDLYLLITMIGYILQQENKSTLPAVFRTISDKLIRRHPHVFTDKKENNPQAIIQQWNDIKKNVEGKKMDLETSVPKTLPPLERALKIQRRVAQKGFDWKSYHGVIDKIREELNELETEITEYENLGNDADREAKDNLKMRVGTELGDLLFALVNLARFIEVDPVFSLHSTNEKVIKRFGYIVEEMKKKEKEVSSENMEMMEKFWNESKKHFP